VILCRWLDFDPRLTWDGLLTFLGGLLAFFAILHQVRHADQGLREQLRVEREARTREDLDRRRTIAIALLEEVRVFARRYVGPTEQSVSGFDSDRGDPSAIDLASPQENPFPIYSANASGIGEYGGELAGSLVTFYGLAGSFVWLLSDWAKVRNQLYVAASNTQATVVARSVLRRVRDLLPVLKQAIEAATNALDRYLGAAQRSRNAEAN
jgi:hypothetical protein